MRRTLYCISFFLVSACWVSAQTVSPDSLPRIWYDRAARAWEEAIPMGNGRMGAMIFGGLNERIQLNHNTLWSGYPEPGNNVRASANLALVRKAVTDGDYETAALHWKKMQGPYSARYLPMADLFIDSILPDSTTGEYISRSLDLQSAVTTIAFTAGGVRFNREIFISHPDKVMVVRLTADKGRSIGFTARLTSKLKHEVTLAGNDYLILRGKAPAHVAHRDTEPVQILYDDKEGEGMNFEVHLKLRIERGTLARTDSSITVSGADAVTLVLAAATSFNGPSKSPGLEGKDPSAQVRDALGKVAGKSFTQLRATHVADYANLFNRVKFKLGSAPGDERVPTDVKLMRSGSGVIEPGLIETYFQFGRYLLISSSRPGGPPANLQGIWNDQVQPPWGSNYTTNINTEMNYWPAEVTNLSECHLPLLEFIPALAVNGAETAATNYGIKDGWCAHHNSDIWAKTSPAGGFEWDPRSQARWSCWPMAGAWLSTHLWEHYAFTGNEQFLRAQAWPLMKGAAQFLLSWLVKGPGDYLVTNPSTSPENAFKINGKEFAVSMASTMDIAIARQLFSNCIDAAAVLGIHDAFTEQVSAALAQLYPYRIGKHGQLQEWFQDWDDPNDHHRHISHLFGLYPGNQINTATTVDLAEAAKQSLIMRGDAGTGWSMAWKVNAWARLGDGNHALQVLKDGLKYVDPNKTPAPTAGGTYPNLFSAHPPFQIDGNLGGTAGITEMLLQSHDGEISILPALPDEWSSGKVSGLKARGSFEIAIEWDGGKVKRVDIRSLIGGICRIRSFDKLSVVGGQSKAAEGPNPNLLTPSPSVPPFEGKSGITSTLEVPKAAFVIDIDTQRGVTYTLMP